jgi:DNA-binding CsgD family transcriptional regulator
MKQTKLKLLFQHFRSEGFSLRRRFLLYIISAVATFLALTIMLLNLFGFLNPSSAQIMGDLDAQLTASADRIEHDSDQLAACAISFSHQLEEQVQNYLTDRQLRFTDLHNNAPELTELQKKLYGTVYLNMQLAPASGAFYILNTTVNSTAETPLYTGIYLKYINLSSENTVNNKFSLYRGSYTTGKENNITFHSGWGNESRTDFFQDCDALFEPGVHYALSPVVKIPETWENARYLYVPLRDRQDNIIGVCGFEINDLLFQLSYKTGDFRWGQLVCGVIDQHQEGYSGQFNSTRYQITSDSDFRITTKKGLTRFEFGPESCVGITKDIFLGNDTFTVGVMIPQAQYQKCIRSGQLQNALLFLILGALALVCCIILSHNYVSPLLKRIEQVKAQELSSDPLNIREIDDLFDFLAARDTAYETRLEELEQQVQTARANATQSQKDYETALRRLDLVLEELEQLTAAQHREIVLEEYEFFVCNLGTLTPTEYRVYELYLAGKSARQIAEILDISENTLKYHNKNIYSKLGISSRKQMLRFAALKKHRDAQSGKQ